MDSKAVRRESWRSQTWFASTNSMETSNQFANDSKDSCNLRSLWQEPNTLRSATRINGSAQLSLYLRPKTTMWKSFGKRPWSSGSKSAKHTYSNEGRPKLHEPCGSTSDRLSSASCNRMNQSTHRWSKKPRHLYEAARPRGTRQLRKFWLRYSHFENRNEK